MVTFLPKPSVIVIPADSANLSVLAIPEDSAGTAPFVSSVRVDLLVHPELAIRKTMSNPINIILFNLILENIFILLSSNFRVEKYYINLTKFSVNYYDLSNFIENSVIYFSRIPRSLLRG